STSIIRDGSRASSRRLPSSSIPMTGSATTTSAISATAAKSRCASSVVTPARTLPPEIGDVGRRARVRALTPTVVIQSKQGIGDVIWHLPYVRAIAAASPGGKVIFLALPSTYAKELLEAEPCIDRTVYFESRGPELKRILHQARLVAALRRLHCSTAWFLDVTVRPAIAALLAG